MSIVLTFPNQICSSVTVLMYEGSEQSTLQPSPTEPELPRRIQNILSQLSKREDATLKKELNECLTSDNLKTVASHLALHAPHLLDTCEKMLSLDLAQHFHIDNVTERAEQEALFIPKPSSRTLSAKISAQIHMKPGLIGRITNYVVALLTWTYSIDIDNPPRNYWSAQGQWMFFRSLIEDGRKIGAILLTYFVTVKKTAAVALGILGVMVGLKVIYQRLHLHQTAQLNRQYFTDLTAEEHPTSIGREQEMDELISCICVPPGERPNIPILIAPPGTGKTQLVEGLAQKIRHGEIPQLKGKQVISVNTANLAQMGGWNENAEYASRLDLMFKQLEGKESNVILFFDEIHNAASAEGAATGGKGLMLESLKTKLLEKKILGILATTEEEYKAHILPNTAFVDRTHPIMMNSLSKERTKAILHRQFVGRMDSEIEVEPAAIDAILEAGERHPTWAERANPRKSIDMLQFAINHVYSWTPMQTQSRISAIEQTIDQLTTALQYKARNNAHWEKEAENTLRDLQKQRKALTSATTEYDALSKLHHSLVHLKELQRTYRQHNYTLIHELANPKFEQEKRKEAEKALIWIEFVVLPAIKKGIDDTVKKINEDYKITVPTKVTAELVKKLFPTDPQP